MIVFSSLIAYLSPLSFLKCWRSVQRTRQSVICKSLWTSLRKSVSVSPAASDRGKKDLLRIQRIPFGNEIEKEFSRRIHHTCQIDIKWAKIDRANVTNFKIECDETALVSTKMDSNSKFFLCKVGRVSFRYSEVFRHLYGLSINLNHSLLITNEIFLKSLGYENNDFLQNSKTMNIYLLNLSFLHFRMTSHQRFVLSRVRSRYKHSHPHSRCHP